MHVDYVLNVNEGGADFAGSGGALTFCVLVQAEHVCRKKRGGDA